MLARTLRGDVTSNKVQEIDVSQTTNCTRLILRGNKAALAYLAHTIRRLAGQIDLVQAEQVVAILALLAAARAEHEDVARLRLVVERVSGAMTKGKRL